MGLNVKLLYLPHLMVNSRKTKEGGYWIENAETTKMARYQTSASVLG